MSTYTGILLLWVDHSDCSAADGVGGRVIMDWQSGLGGEAMKLTPRDRTEQADPIDISCSQVGHL